VSFTRIGDIAARLIADPAKLAAAAQDTQRNGGDEPVAQGMCPSPSPMRRAVEETAAQFMNKKGEARSPASGSSGDSKREGDNAPASRLDLGGRLKLVSTTCEPTHRPNSGRPIRRVGSHLVLVSSHSPTTQSAKSGTA
jgi:hypothetical protein